MPWGGEFKVTTGRQSIPFVPAVAGDGDRFSSVILNIVKSYPFQHARAVPQLKAVRKPDSPSGEAIVFIQVDWNNHLLKGIVMASRPISRRAVLRGIGKGVGISVALPLLEAMLPRRILGQVAAAAEGAAPLAGAAPINRLLLLYLPNGIHTPFWYPKLKAPITKLRNRFSHWKNTVKIFWCSAD